MHRVMTLIIPVTGIANRQLFVQFCHLPIICLSRCYTLNCTHCNSCMYAPWVHIYMLYCTVGVLVEVPPMDQSVNVNDTLLLACVVSGSEPISYQWLKDGVPLQDDGRVSGSNDIMLMVEPVEGDDFGGYQCNASNDVDQVLSEVAMVAGT